MKKAFFLTVLILTMAASLSAATIKDRDIKTLSGGDRAKLGVHLGFPSGVTFGYRPSNWMEWNISAGYNFIFAQSALISTNALFTLFNIPIGDTGVLPFSVGPQVNFIIGNRFMLEAVGIARLEYTFGNIPLNLFIDGGAGVRFFDDNVIRIAWNSSLGVRYVF